MCPLLVPGGDEDERVAYFPTFRASSAFAERRCLRRTGIATSSRRSADAEGGTRATWNCVSIAWPPYTAAKKNRVP